MAADPLEQHRALIRRLNEHIRQRGQALVVLHYFVSGFDA